MAQIVSLLVGFVVLLVVGVVLRRSGRVPEQASASLNAIVLNVTLPSLIVASMSGASVGAGAARAVLASTVALVTTALITWRLGLWRRWSRPVIGSAIMTASFCNTAFLGIPVVRAVFPAAEPSSSLAWSTSILIDAGITGVGLWTLGVIIAARFGGGGEASLRDSAKQLLTQPTTWALVLAATLNATSLALPPWWRSLFESVGVLTGPLVFLSLGASLDFSAVRFAGRPLAYVVVLKLLVSPAIAAACCVALSVPSPASTVAVLQSGMSTAMVGSILAATAGCDKTLAIAAAVVTTVVAMLTLPLWMTWAALL